MGLPMVARVGPERLGLDIVAVPLAEGDPYLDAYNRQYNALGTTKSGSGTNADRVASAVTHYNNRLQLDICPRQIEAFADLLGGIRRTLPDARLIVLDIPLHPEMIAAHPFGPSPFDLASREAESVAGTIGADYVDAQDMLSADEFGDLIHANALGRQRVTERLAAILE